MKKNADAPPGTAIDRGLLLFIVLTLVLLVGVESFVVAWGLNKAAALTSGIHRQPDHLLAFTKWIAMILFPLALFNAAIGALIARELSVPLVRIRTVMNEITRGNLEHELFVSSWDALEDYTKDCQKMLETLRRLLYRDHQSVREAGAHLENCHALLVKGDGAADRKKAIDLLNLARSEISVINYHFTKGRKEPS